MSKSYDVIVVGAGTAGVPAALAAASRGLSVALVEAADDIGGTLTLSGGSISAAGTSIQAKAGVSDDAQAHFQDAMRINHGTGQHDMIRDWMQRAPEAIEWLLSIGWTCTPHEPVFAPEHDLYTTPRTYRSTEQGFSLIHAYKQALAHPNIAAHIDLFLNTRATNIQMEDGRATGIIANQSGTELQLKAASVILTTGGFNGSADYWQKLHGLVPLRYHIDTVQGDGIDIAQKAGGQLWYTDELLPSFGGTRDLGAPASAWVHSVINPNVRPAWEVFVNQRGERFMNEDERIMDSRERAIMVQPDWVFWVIYDEAIRRKSPPLFKWEDRKLDSLFAGFDEDYVQANTLAELAEKCGLPSRKLAATIDTYNRGQAVGYDAFKRQHLPAPIQQGPFYAVKHYGFSICCYPGIAVNADLQMLRPDGSVIPGLYAAGEAIGIGWLGHSFLSGGIVSSAVTFGRRLGLEVPSAQSVAATSAEYAA